MTAILKYLIPFILFIVFLIPGYAFFSTNSEALSTLAKPQGDGIDKLGLLFRLCGLYAMTLVWAQISIGPFTKPLSNLYGTRNVVKWHRTEGLFALLFATLHPLFFYLISILSLGPLSVFSALYNYLGDSPLLYYGYLGPLAWTIMVTTVLTAINANKPWLRKRWRIIHLLNYVLFIAAFLHSYNIGSDVQTDLLQKLYIVYGISFIASVIYRIGYRRFWIGRGTDPTANPTI
jgi:DMSO/TMAO reductase YedYZ heme-binding membrane subunit